MSGSRRLTEEIRAQYSDLAASVQALDSSKQRALGLVWCERLFASPLARAAFPTNGAASEPQAVLSASLRRGLDWLWVDEEISEPGTLAVVSDLAQTSGLLVEEQSPEWNVLFVIIERLARSEMDWLDVAWLAFQELVGCPGISWQQVMMQARVFDRTSKSERDAVLAEAKRVESESPAGRIPVGWLKRDVELLSIWRTSDFVLFARSRCSAEVEHFANYCARARTRMWPADDLPEPIWPEAIWNPGW